MRRWLKLLFLPFAIVACGHQPTEPSQEIPAASGMISDECWFQPFGCSTGPYYYSYDGPSGTMNGWNTGCPGCSLRGLTTLEQDRLNQEASRLSSHSNFRCRDLGFGLNRLIQTGNIRFFDNQVFTPNGNLLGGDFHLQSDVTPGEGHVWRGSRAWNEVMRTVRHEAAHSLVDASGNRPLDPGFPLQGRDNAWGWNAYDFASNCS